MVEPLTLKDVAAFFPDKKIAAFNKLSGGFSGAQMVKFSVDGKFYVARRSGGIKGPAAISQEFTLQKLAADAGVAPSIIGMDVKHGLVVMEFIENKMPAQTAPRPQFQSMILGLLRTLAAIPLPEGNIQTVNQYESMRSIQNKIPNGFLPPTIEKIMMGIAATPWPSGAETLVHLDFHGRNLLFNGERLYLIDWEMAARSHHFVDVADYTNAQFASKDQGHKVLTEFLQHEAGLKEKEEFDNLRIIMFGFRASFAFLQAVERGIAFDANTQQCLNAISWQTLPEAFAALDAGQMDGSALHWLQFGILIARETLKLL